MPLHKMHHSASVGSGVTTGIDCVVWAFTTVGRDVQMGDGCVIGSNCYVGHGSMLGHFCHLNHGVFLPNGSQLGDRVFLGPNVTCTDDKHPRVNNADYCAQPPVIEDDVSIGAGATILPGIRLGKGCMVAAGAVVTRDVPPGETWAGVPARKLHKWPEPGRGGGWLRRQMADDVVGGDDHGSQTWAKAYTARSFTNASGYVETEEAGE
jgi:UDP-2-acetamido-3-amino-2,3-dideoxy-glucuronate N-acetyltransferase